MELMRQSSQWSPKSVHAGTGASDVIGYQPRAPFLLSSNTMGNTSKLGQQPGGGDQRWTGNLSESGMGTGRGGHHEPPASQRRSRARMAAGQYPDVLSRWCRRLDLQLGAMGVEKRDARRLAPLLAGAWICARSSMLRTPKAFGEWVQGADQPAHRRPTRPCYDSDAETGAGTCCSRQRCCHETSACNWCRTTDGDTLIEQNMGNVKPHLVDHCDRPAGRTAGCRLEAAESTQPYLVVGGS